MAKQKICMIVDNSITNDPRVYKESTSLKSFYDIIIIGIAEENSKNIEINEGRKFLRVRLNQKAKFLSFALKAALLAAKQEADIYHAHDLPSLVPAYLAVLKNRLNGKYPKLIYDSHELFVKSGKNDWKKIIWKILETFLIQKPNVIITANRIRTEIMKKMYKIKHKQIFPIRNVPQLINIKADSTLKRRLNIPKKNLVIIYQGVIGHERGLEETINAIAITKNRKFITHLIVGSGTNMNNLKRLAFKYQLEKNIIFTGKVPMKEVPKYIAISDVGMVLFKNISLNNYYAAPNKLYEYMALGTLSIASNFPGLSDVKKENVGLLVNPENIKEIASAIDWFFENKNKLGKMKKNAILASRREYNWEMEEKQLLKAYSLLNQ